MKTEEIKRIVREQLTKDRIPDEVEVIVNESLNELGFECLVDVGIISTFGAYQKEMVGKTEKVVIDDIVMPRLKECMKNLAIVMAKYYGQYITTEEFESAKKNLSNSEKL